MFKNGENKNSKYEKNTFFLKKYLTQFVIFITNSKLHYYVTGVVKESLKEFLTHVLVFSNKLFDRDLLLI